LRCCRDVFFAAASLASFLPAIVISISFWPLSAFRSFFEVFEAFEVFAGSAPPALRRSASIRSTTFSLRGRSFGVIGFPRYQREIKVPALDLGDIRLLELSGNPLERYAGVCAATSKKVCTDVHATSVRYF
jgi:hypothetical protein